MSVVAMPVVAAGEILAAASKIPVVLAMTPSLTVCGDCAEDAVLGLEGAAKPARAAPEGPCRLVAVLTAELIEGAVLATFFG